MKNLVKKHPFILFLLILPFFLYNPFLVFVIMGLLGSYLCLEGYSTLKKIEESGIECDGKIVKFVKGRNSKTPLVEFTTKSGELIREEPFVYASANVIQAYTMAEDIGKTVLIKYNPDHPKDFIFIDEVGSNSFILVICIIVCLAFMAFGIFGLLGYIG